MDFMNKFSMMTMSIYAYASCFKNTWKSFNLEFDNVCNHHWFDLQISEGGLCIMCHKFVFKNDLNVFSKEANS